MGENTASLDTLGGKTDYKSHASQGRQLVWPAAVGKLSQTKATSQRHQCSVEASSWVLISAVLAQHSELEGQSDNPAEKLVQFAKSNWVDGAAD